MTALRPVDQSFIADLHARGTAPSGVTVSSTELCLAADLTYRQIDWSTRTGRSSIRPRAARPTESRDQLR